MSDEQIQQEILDAITQGAKAFEQIRQPLEQALVLIKKLRPKDQ